MIRKREVPDLTTSQRNDPTTKPKKNIILARSWEEEGEKGKVIFD